jgi:hypothetical protein
MDVECIHLAHCWGEDSDAQSSLTGEKTSGGLITNNANGVKRHFVIRDGKIQEK